MDLLKRAPSKWWLQLEWVTSAAWRRGRRKSFSDSNDSLGDILMSSSPSSEMNGGQGYVKQNKHGVVVTFPGKQANFLPPSLLDPDICKGLAFSKQERDAQGLKGYLPASVRTMDCQVEVVMENLRRLGDDVLSKFLLLRSLQDYNTRLFYKAMTQHTEELLPLVYTPVVGTACLEYSQIFFRPRGMYLTLEDKGHLKEIIGKWYQSKVEAIVVTDGERILGLGDLGANGMGIPVGKLALYTALAGLDPSTTLPVLLDVGTNNESIRNNPFYIGLNRPREVGETYDQFVDEFMKAVVDRYGPHCLIQFEDFGNKNAFRLLEKYIDHYCTFNDDIQGTSSVTLSGILSSLKITGKNLKDQVILFLGAGEAALGTSKLLVEALVDEGLSETEAKKKIWLIDSRGLIVKDRLKELTEEKKVFAQDHLPAKDLIEIIQDIQPTALIGLSAQPKVFNQHVLEAMASINERPIIFALSNPTSKAECTAEEAYVHTKGKCVFASGSPFKPVVVEGQTFYPGQGNNAYIFPGVALAVLGTRSRRVPQRCFLEAARALTDTVSQEDLDKGRVFPSLDKIRTVSVAIAARVAHKCLYPEKVADLKPEPSDLEQHFASYQWSPDYSPTS